MYTATYGKISNCQFNAKLRVWVICRPVSTIRTSQWWNSTKTCRLINNHIYFFSEKISSAQWYLFNNPQALCRDSTMYRLKLLTSPEGNFPTPIPNPIFFYANKGCNSGDLTYRCGISVHPYFYVLSAFENQNN